jgi:hypothetical protein
MVCRLCRRGEQDSGDSGNGDAHCNRPPRRAKLAVNASHRLLAFCHAEYSSRCSPRVNWQRAGAIKFAFRILNSLLAKLDFSLYSEPRNLTAVFAEWGFSDTDVTDIERVSDFIPFGMWNYNEGGGERHFLVVR